MKVLIESRFTVSATQEAEINTHISALTTYNNKITFAKVHFKTDEGTKPNSILAVIKIYVPDSTVIASATSQQFMDAFSGALTKVKSQLRKAKDIRSDY